MLRNEKTLESMLDAITQATLSIVEENDLNKILQQITDVSRSIISAQYAAIGVYDQNGQLKDFVFSGLTTDKSGNMPIPKAGNNLLGTIIKNNRTVRISQLNQSSNHLQFSQNTPPPTSFLGSPIITGDDMTGGIYLTNKTDGTAFNQLDEKIIEILAAHAAVAIRKAILSDARNKSRQELQQRNSQLAALNQAAMAISGELSLDKVLQQIVDSARELIHAEYAALGVPNNDGHLDTFIYSGMAREKAILIDHLPKGYGLLGAISRERKPIRIPNISADKRSFGFPENHPPMDSFLGVPVIAGGELLGNLYLSNKQNADEFSQEDQELVQLLAAHAAVAIQNAHLFEQVGRLAIVEERTRIGMDLHDGIIQSIYAVGLTLESTRLALPAYATEADKMLEQAIDGLNETIRDIRNFILDLKPHRFSGNLRQGLSRLIREFQANTLVMVTLTAPEGTFQGLPTSVARTIFLTTQEALANIARHARATEVHINIQRTNIDVSATIADDGIGFDTQTRRTRIGHGISNMQARMEELNGSFFLESTPGKGTIITLQLPLN